MKRSLLLRPFVFATVLGANLAALPTFASESYPATIKSTLKLKTVPECTLCHANNLGGANTVVTKFGLSLQKRGVTGRSNVRSLTSALSKEESDPVDSDGDSVFDLEELRDGSNPNVVDREPPPPPPPPPGEGGSAGAMESGGVGSVPGHDPEGGTTSASGGGSSSGGVASGGRTSSGGATAPEEPELPEIPEIPPLQTGCSLGAATPSGISCLVALSLIGLLRSRRARRLRSGSED